MIRSIVLTTTLLISAPSAFALTELDGTWRFRKYECSSGAMPRMHDNLESGPDNTEDMTINGTHVLYTKKIQSEFSKKETERLLEPWLWELESAQRLPSGAKRDEKIAQSTKGLDGARRIASGVTCTYTDEATFRVNGNLLEFSERKLVHDDCPDGSPYMKGNGPFGPEVSQYEVSGDSLRLQNPTAPIPRTGEDHTACPPGDFVIELFKRLK